jgi:hypothetical protein
MLLVLEMGYGLDVRGTGIRFPAGIRNVSLLHSDQTASAAQPAQFAPGAFFQEVKRPRREADHSPPPSAEPRYAGLYLHSPISLRGLGLNYWNIWTNSIVASLISPLTWIYVNSFSEFPAFHDVNSGSWLIWERTRGGRQYCNLWLLYDRILKNDNQSAHFGGVGYECCDQTWEPKTWSRRVDCWRITSCYQLQPVTCGMYLRMVKWFEGKATTHSLSTGNVFQR